MDPALTAQVLAPQPVLNAYGHRAMPGYNLAELSRLPGIEYSDAIDIFAAAPPTQPGFFLLTENQSKVFFFASLGLQGQFVMEVGDFIDPIDQPAFAADSPRLLVAWVPAIAAPYSDLLLRRDLASIAPVGPFMGLVPVFPSPPIESDCRPVILDSHATPQ